MKRISKYFRGVGEEARRIRWPSRRDLWISVGKVLLIAVVVSLFIYLCDYLIIQILQSIERAYPSSSDSSSSAEAVEAIRYGVSYLTGGRL